jgi:hypothetical protein
MNSGAAGAIIVDIYYPDREKYTPLFRTFPLVNRRETVNLEREFISRTT